MKYNVYFNFGLRTGQSAWPAFRPNGSYQETEKEHCTACKSWSHRFGSPHELVNLKLPGDAASSREETAVESAPRIQELLAALALHVVQGTSCKNVDLGGI